VKDMSKSVSSLCLVLLFVCFNTAQAEIVIPTKPEDFTRDIYNRLSCGGYAIMEYDSGTIDRRIDIYIEDTSEYICSIGTYSTPYGTCPPPHWFSAECDKYYSAYTTILHERFLLEFPNIKWPPHPPHLLP